MRLNFLLPTISIVLGFSVISPIHAQQGDESTPSINEIQSVVLDYGLNYMSLMADTLNSLEPSESAPAESDRAALILKHDTGLSAMSIATASNPQVALVDFVVLAGLQKRMVRETWGPQYFPESYAELLETLATLEQLARENAALVLSQDEFAYLDSSLERWWEANPGETDVTFLRFSELSTERGRIATAESPGGMMRSLKRATESIDHTRLMAERQSMYLKAMPVFIGWQAEVSLYNILDRPDIARQREELSAALEGMVNASKVVEDIRDIISEERAAAFEDLDQRIVTQREELLAEVREMIDESGAGARLLIDYLFWRVLVLVLVLCAGIFAGLAFTRPRVSRGD